MKGAILLASLEPDQYNVNVGPGMNVGADTAEGYVEFEPVVEGSMMPDKTMIVEFDGPLYVSRAVVRGEPQQGKGFVVNLGGSMLHLSYQRRTEDGSGYVGVGPTRDYLSPMQAKELGLGPGMVWVFDVV